MLASGNVFSFNETVGKRTKERRIKKAGVYIRGQVGEDIGGGICQVSTTLTFDLFSTKSDKKVRLKTVILSKTEPPIEFIESMTTKLLVLKTLPSIQAMKYRKTGQ
jgi:hypothetical protein